MSTGDTKVEEDLSGFLQTPVDAPEETLNRSNPADTAASSDEIDEDTDPVDETAEDRYKDYRNDPKKWKNYILELLKEKAKVITKTHSNLKTAYENLEKQSLLLQQNIQKLGEDNIVKQDECLSQKAVLEAEVIKYKDLLSEYDQMAAELATNINNYLPNLSS